MNKTDAINCIQDIIDVANSHGSACVYSRNGGVAQLENVLECLKNSEPVVHAHWEYHKDGLPYCSRCGDETCANRRYCPSCGAKMDKEE